MPSHEPRVPRTPATPQLPPMTETTTVSYRHEVNPALATNLLNELHVAVTQHQHQLRLVIQQIKGLYDEGPVVDGWLESGSEKTPATQADTKQAKVQPSVNSPSLDASALFRHGEVEDIMAYVQAMEPTEIPPSERPKTSDAKPSSEVEQQLSDPPSGAPTYYLCQLDQNGQVRSQPCPAAQVPTVSMAIVRHQKLVKLVAKKTTIEAKVKQVVETLGDLKRLLS